jgi:Cu(I)/Ag(I) efflux system protein CusF
MDKLLLKATAVIGFAAFSLSAHAQDKGATGPGNANGMKMDCMANVQNMKDMKGMKMDCAGSSSLKDSSSVESLSSGEVMAVDKASNSVTLKHGPIKSKTVDMGAMTMTFPVQKPSLLAKVKVGNKVKFNVENVKDTATVTALVVQK